MSPLTSWLLVIVGYLILSLAALGAWLLIDTFREHRRTRPTSFQQIEKLNMISQPRDYRHGRWR